MYKFPYNGENVAQIIEELRPLNLPDFKGVAHLSRALDDEGQLIKEADGKPKKVVPYLYIKTSATSQTKFDEVAVVINAHVAQPLPEPIPSPLTVEELYDMLKAKGFLVDSDRPRPRS